MMKAIATPKPTTTPATSSGTTAPTSAPIPAPIPAATAHTARIRKPAPAALEDDTLPDRYGVTARGIGAWRRRGSAGLGSCPSAHIAAMKPRKMPRRPS